MVVGATRWDETGLPGPLHQFEAGVRLVLGVVGLNPDQANPGQSLQLGVQLLTEDAERVGMGDDRNRPRCPCQADGGLRGEP